MTTPLKAIRAKCLDCSETPRDVRLCPCTDCALFPYRTGHNPKRKGLGGQYDGLQFARKKKRREPMISAPESKTEADLDGNDSAADMAGAVRQQVVALVRSAP